MTATPPLRGLREGEGRKLKRRASFRIPGPVAGDGAGVDAEVGTGDHRGIVGGEEDRRPAVVAGHRQLLHRDALAERLHEPVETLWALDRAAPALGALERLRRIGRSWCQAVDADAVAYQLHRRRAPGVDQPRLRSGIGDVAR